MTTLRTRFLSAVLNFAPRLLPFADVATPDLPLTRLLRLSLFQVTVGMAMVLLVGTLNRVMIVELAVPASLVGIMLAMPLVFAPLRALIGFRSDHHTSALGWRRFPFLWKGSLAQFAGFTIMPFALLVLAGQGESGSLPPLVGQVTAAASFLLVGAGIHTVQTAGLALATDLTRPESHAKVVGLMYVMLLIGMMISALIFGTALLDFTPGRLVRVIQTTALLTLVLNVIAVWKQEPRRRSSQLEKAKDEPDFLDSWRQFCAGPNTYRRLVVVGLGTMAFGMADILLEPFGGHILNLSVSVTTALTALFAAGGLTGFAIASKMIGKGTDPFAAARLGAMLGLPAFALVISAAPLQMTELFVAGNFLIGFGGALFAHGTLTATMNLAPAAQIGLALGAWGAVQATAAGIGVAASGTIRDIVTAIDSASRGIADGISASGYMTVYALEVTLLLVTLLVLGPLLRNVRRSATDLDASAYEDARFSNGPAETSS